MLQGSIQGCKVRLQGSVPEVLERDALDVGVVADDHVALDVFEVEGNVRKLGDVLDEDVALHRGTDRDMDHQIHAREGSHRRRRLQQFLE